MMRKFWTSVISASLALCILTGCGNTVSSEEAISDYSTEVSGDDGEVEEITFMVWTDIDNSEDLTSRGYRETIDRFNSDYEGRYRVRVVSTELDDYYSKLSNMISVGKAPDVFIISPGCHLDDYVEPGMVAKLDEYLADGWRDTFVSDSVFAGCRYDDGIYAVPLNIAAACMFYNKKMFDDAGVSVPTTFDELLAACQKLQDKGYVPITASGGTPWTIALIQGYLCDRSGFTIEDVTDHTVDWTDENLMKAGRQLQELSKYFQPTAATDTFEETIQDFVSGEAAIYIQGSWAIGVINGVGEGDFADNVGVAPFPNVKGSQADTSRVMSKSDSLAMYSKTEHTEAAIELMKYFTDETAQKYMAEVGGKIPVINVDYDESAAPPELSCVYDMIKNSKASFGFYDESLISTDAGNLFANCCVDIVKGKEPEEAFSPMQAFYTKYAWVEN